MSTIFVGVDVGSLTAEAVAVRDGEVVAAATRPVRPDPVDSARDVLDKMLARGGFARAAIRRTVATGYGRERLAEAGLAADHLSEISCHGYGVFCLDPAVRTIVDIGGQDAKAIRIDDRGELQQFAMNDKCAAGTGHFLEHMGRTLGVPLPELGPLALSSRRPLEVSNRCTIFAETEVVSALQQGRSPAEVCAGICRALAERVSALVRKVHPVPAVTMTGGVAKNLAVRRELERRLGLRLTDLDLDPQIVGAYGAAMAAARQGGAR